MKFHRVIGKIDPDLVEKARAHLSKVFLDLGLSSKSSYTGSGMGGDPLVFSLIFPVQHIATRNIPTAGTDGKRYYWNPKFVLSKSVLGMRLICAHEAFHAIYMHPERRCGRHPQLWNIAVDYIVNGVIMEDLTHRKLNPAATFTKELGNFCTLPQYMEFLKNPMAKIPGTDHWVADKDDDDEVAVPLPKVDEERELTDDEKKEMDKQEAKVRYFFADPDLAPDMKRPERIYDALYNLMPKCPECGRLGVYSPPKDKNEQGDSSEDQDDDKADKKSKKKSAKSGKDDAGKADKSDKKGKKSKKKKEDKGDDHEDSADAQDAQGPQCGHDGHSHDHGDSSGGDAKSDQPGDQPGDSGDGQGQSAPSPKSGKSKGCGTCKGQFDIFGQFDTLDDHMDASESPEKMAKRLADAIETAKQMAGTIPAGIEGELGDLIAPKLRWQDIIRAKISRSRDGNAKNDWTRFRNRPLFAGLFIPKKINQVCNFGCLLDTSGSMSQEDMTYGLSQLQAVDQRSEGWVVPADAEIYWDKATKIKKCNAEELKKVKDVGHGGTMFSNFFTDYEKHFGKCDFLMVITDGYLIDTDIANMVNPGIDTLWIITSGCDFKAPFGRVFNLND